MEEEMHVPKPLPKTKLKPRKLRGHDDSVNFCIVPRQRSNLIVTGGDDGRVCWFDLRCRNGPRLVMDVSVEAISSLAFKSDNEDNIYVSSGKEIKCFDVRQATAEWKPLENYNYNKEEINQIVCNSKSSFLAAADDHSEVKIIDIRQQCLYKTLRGGHLIACYTVQFLPWRPWEVISGGTDSSLILWDFSTGRRQELVDFGIADASRIPTGGQFVNPGLLLDITVPEVDILDKFGKICAVSRGDGVVSVINIESEMAAKRSKSSSSSRKGSQSRSKDGSSTGNADADHNGTKRLHLDYTLGGHTAALSSVTFSLFGERGKFLISAGIDKLVKVWNWSNYSDAGSSDGNNDLLHLNMEVARKVNCVCTTPADTDNLVVCDTSKVVKVYSLG